jgi:hypothetical protein
MNRYRFDAMLEYTLSKEGRETVENVVLGLIAVGSVAGILALGRR